PAGTVVAGVDVDAARCALATSAHDTRTRAESTTWCVARWFMMGSAVERAPAMPLGPKRVARDSGRIAAPLADRSRRSRLRDDVRVGVAVLKPDTARLDRGADVAQPFRAARLAVWQA